MPEFKAEIKGNITSMIDAYPGGFLLLSFAILFTIIVWLILPSLWNRREKYKEKADDRRIFIIKRRTGKILSLLQSINEKLPS